MTDPNDGVTYPLKLAHLALLLLVVSCGGSSAPSAAEVSAPDAADAAVQVGPDVATPPPEPDPEGGVDSSTVVEAESPDVTLLPEPAPEASPDVTATIDAAGPEPAPEAAAVVDAGQEAEAAPFMCAERLGTFSETSLEHQGGNCGAIPEQIYSASSQDAAMQLPIGCFGTVTASADNCVITLDTNCPGATGYRVIQRGKVTWAPNGASGAGTIQALITVEASGAQYCSSVYDVSERKL